MIRLAYPDLDFKEVKGELEKTIESGWLTKGPKTRELEGRISRYLGIRHAVAVSSGTAALHLALLSLDIGPGDEVIVPDFTFPAVANVVELCGAKPVLADIEEDGFNIDPRDVKKRITRRTRAVIVVHQFGYPADMAGILKIARAANLYVIEDAACALGARYRGKKCGTMGHIGCFSFHPRKIITTGEGGVIVTDKAGVAGRLRMLRDHGMSQKGRERNFIFAGFNYRIPEISSLLGLVQLGRIEGILKKRTKLAGEFRRIISRSSVISPAPSRIDRRNRSTHQAFLVRINERIEIPKLIAFLKDKGIESTVSSVVLHTQPYYRRKYGFKKNEFKNSSRAFKRHITVPFHCRLKKKDFLKIAARLEEYFKTRTCQR